MPPRKTLRVSILLPRRPALVAAWLLSLLLAGGVGWVAARMESLGGLRSSGQSESIVARAAPAPHTAASSGIVASEVSRPPRSERRDHGGSPTAASTPEPDPVARPAAPVEVARPEALPREPAVDPTPAPPQTVATADLEEAPLAHPGSADHESIAESAAPMSEPIAEQPQESVTTRPAASPESGALARAERADRLAESGEDEHARREAEGLLAEYLSHSGLTAALREDGAGETRARLSALRVVQLAGGEALSTELARELKREYLSVPEVVESIRRWRILTPRITSLESSIVDGGKLVVTGTLENPDIGDIRRVFIQVEALDTTGSVLTATRARVRPKTLGPGSRGSFTVRLEALDPNSVLRTRASVVEWETEVLDAG